MSATGYPLFAKPRRGTGARGVQKITRPEQLARISAADVPMIVQECLLPDDQEYSVEFADLETGIISLLDASYILLEHGDHDLYLG